jgi:hypothetical protein
VDAAALVIAVVGVVLATLSLIWQALTFFLTGPRVRVRLSEGLRAPHGGVVIAPPSIYTQAGRAALEADGYTEHVLAVTARNAGRAPVSLLRWSLRFGNDAIITYPGGGGNVPLPHRLEPATDISWYAPLQDVVPYVEDFVDQSDDARTLRGEVDTALGKTVVSRQRIIVGADGTTRTRHGRRRRFVAWVRRKPLY